MLPSRLLCALGLGLALTPGLVLAQPPPDRHGGATSAPLFVEDLPVGTISVRLDHPSMTDAVVGVDVVGVWTTPEGKQESRTVRTASDGRAVFTAVPAGSSFQARASAEGETLTSAEFVVPSEGGSRLLLLVGAQAEEDPSDTTGAAPPSGKPDLPRMVGVRSGKVESNDRLPAGTVELRVVSAGGQAMAGVQVFLGRTQGASAKVEVVDAVTDDSGRARFEHLKTGEGSPYGAAIEHDGLRVGTSPFTLDDTRGAAGEIRIPAQTSDLAVLRLSRSSRMMLELREDGIAVLQNLIVENTSDKVFNPGPAGLLLPLPDGFVGAEKLPGGSEVEIKEGAGVVLHSPVPPTPSLADAPQVRIGYALSTHEERDFEIVQPMPLGMEGGMLLVPGAYAIGLSAPGLRARPPERDDAGNDLRSFDLESVPPGHALRLTVRGLPTHDQAGKWIAGILAGLLVAGGIVAAARSRAAVSGEAKAG
jgi:hypothetical protein